jgi:hypothetical protein
MRTDRVMPRRSLRERLSIVLIALALLFLLLWMATLFRGFATNLYTEVLVPKDSYTSHQRAIAASRGRFWFAYVRAEVIEQSAPHAKQTHFWYSLLPRDDEVSRYNGPGWMAWLGIDWKWTDNSSVGAQGHYVYHELFFCVPYWLLIALTGGIGWGIGRRPRLVRRRIKRGLCVACGYDVRATPDRCPECGHVPVGAVDALPASASA